MAECGDDYVSSLSVDVLEKAKRELNEIPEQRVEFIRELRERIATRPDEELAMFSRGDDAFLLCFLRARKFDVERSLELYVNYHSHRRRHVSIMRDYHPCSVERVLRAGVISVLDQRSRDGCRVVVLNAGLWDTEAMPVDLMVRATLLVLDHLIEEEETQVQLDPHSHSALLEACVDDLLTSGTGAWVLVHTEPGWSGLATGGPAS